MAIRFTPEYNKRIERIAKNFNSGVIRANKQGKIRKERLPDLVSAKTLKTSYSRKADLERELKTLESFTRKGASSSYAIGISNYDIDTIRRNKRATIKYFEGIRDIIKDKGTDKYPGQAGRLRTIEKNLDILRKSTTEATEDELESMLAYVDKYRKSFERQATGYRGFMSEIELVIDRVNQGASEDEKITDEQKDAFFKKFSQLTPEELFELYERKDLIKRVYLLADSPKYTGGKLKLHSTVTDARDLINTLMEEADLMIAQVKNK